jgi:hypothetical protein
MLKFTSSIVICLIFSQLLYPNTADWSRDALIPKGENRENIFNLSIDELKLARSNGLIHAQVYPVNISGLLIPYRPLMNVLNSDSQNPLKLWLYEIGKDVTGFYTESDFYKWLGLSENKSENEPEVYKIPFPNGSRDNFYIGAGLIKTPLGDGLTFSCFTCHAQNLFGRVVVGLTNKRPRANHLFHLAIKTIPHVPTILFKKSSDATDLETEMFVRTKNNLKSVYTKDPETLGLDTSLSQVALSLSRRNADDYATKSSEFEENPRENELERHIADSKPMPWWNVKYKTRWLADGSIVEGNPIFTNFLWNEIGRGSDLHDLEKWMNENQKKIDDLTATVFSTQAPLWTDFFLTNSIDINKAKRGEKIFIHSCANCHGNYEKAWNDHSKIYSDVEILKTLRVVYHEKTPVKDVGTDPGRYQGMKYFAESLNNLAISKKMKTVVVPQVGYVPPPLVGIWARYPYFHNNSIPNLCQLLNPPNQRTKIFVQGPSLNAKTDYDMDCVGYPLGKKMPSDWWSDEEAIYDTTKIGLSNAGHYKMLVNEDGSEKYTLSDKKDLIEFLKTL